MSANVAVAFDVRNKLGEGPVWLGDKLGLAWCDILGRTVYVGLPGVGITNTYLFSEPVSAIFPTDGDDVLAATADGIYALDLASGTQRRIVEVESDRMETRANDGRVAPGGSIWLGTMSRRHQPNAGRLYHIVDGQTSVLREPLTIPNATCFSPDGTRAYVCDTPEQRILTCTIDPETAAPTGPWELFVDLSREGLNPDGATVDSAGYVWNAQWGSGRVARYAPNGEFDRAIEFPVTQITCPAFGGPDLTTLFVTSAWEGLSKAGRERQPLAGAVFAVDVDVPGLPERRVVGDWWRRG
ncbi:MAG: SMP-30/gluconolactonase/LRE family protein [Pseudomonadota bacterium]